MLKMNCTMVAEAFRVPLHDQLAVMETAMTKESSKLKWQDGYSGQEGDA